MFETRARDITANYGHPLCQTGLEQKKWSWYDQDDMYMSYVLQLYVRDRKANAMKIKKEL